MTVVMGVLIVSFGVWGIADIFKGFGQSTLAKIGGTEITSDQFRTLYTDKLQQIGRQLGRPMTSEQARNFGLDRQLLQQVIAEAALDEEARRLRLGQSDADVVRAIATDPNFQVNGKFDPNVFAQIIRQFGYTEQRYVAEQRRIQLRRQIAGTIAAGVEAPKSEMEALSRFQNEERVIDYVRLDAAQAGTIDPPSPETLASYFEERKPLFRAPEYRKIAILTVTTDELAKKVEVSDEDARKLFEQRRDDYVTPERRQVSQIPFPTEAEAKAARERIAQGLSFDDLAKERSLTPADTDLGLASKGTMGDAAIADAAFALPLNEVSQPVKGTLVTALLKVTKIEPGSTASYESVAADIKRALARDRARAAMQDLRNKIEDERGGGANIAEAAQKLGLNALIIEAVDRSGRGPDGTPVSGLPQGVDVISAAFASDVGVENETMQINGGELWFDVLGITPSRERPLEEVKGLVETRWRDEQVATRLRAKATTLVDKLNAGTAFTDAASADGLRIEKSAPFKRNATLNGLPPKAVETAFRTAKDGATLAEGTGASDWFVFKVTDVTAPPVDAVSEDAKKLSETVRRAMGDELIAQYVAQLQTDLGVSINDSALAIATGAASSQ